LEGFVLCVIYTIVDTALRKSTKTSRTNFPVARITATLNPLKGKVKLPYYRPAQAQRVPGG
jgi:hypothetical protein